MFLLAATSVAASCTSATRPSLFRFDRVVCRDRQRRFDVPVHDSIAAALAAAGSSGAATQRILLANGRWKERLRIESSGIELVGEDRQRCIITASAAAGTPGPDGKPLGTWGCATMTVTAPRFAASNLTIENGFDYVGELLRPTLPAIGSNGPQAVALMLADGSDRAMFRDVDIIGHQDTLFADAGRSRFSDCRISGSVDFIFGAGQSLFDRCELHSRFRPGKSRQGYIAAPSTLRNAPFGLLFHRCRLTCEADVPDATVALGRPWRPARQFVDGHYGDPDALGAAAFIDCEMAAHVTMEGWDPMKYTTRDGSRIELQPGEARLFEYANAGPGARPHVQRRQLSRQAAEALVAVANS